MCFCESNLTTYDGTFTTCLRTLKTGSYKIRHAWHTADVGGSFVRTKCTAMGPIQMLPNALGDGVPKFREKSVTKLYGSTLLALRGGGPMQISRKT